MIALLAANPGRRGGHKSARKRMSKFSRALKSFRKSARKARKRTAWPTLFGKSTGKIGSRLAMAKHKRRRTGRRNFFSVLSNPHMGVASLTAGARAGDSFRSIPKDAIGITGIIAGVAVNAFADQFIKGHASVPAVLKSGIGNYAAGIATAMVAGMIANKVNPKLGRSIRMGGMVETGGRLVTNVSFPHLNGFDDTLDLNSSPTLFGMGDYFSPAQMRAATLADQGQAPFGVPYQPLTGAHNAMHPGLHPAAAAAHHENNPGDDVSSYLDENNGF